MEFLIHHIEALIFCATSPITIEEIKQCLQEMFDTEIPEEDIKKALEELQKKYEGDSYPFEVVHLAKGWQFLTKPAYQASISLLLKQQARRKLSTSAMETLAIVAYRQPVTKSEVEQIRGVNCDYTIQKLLEKQVIEIKGKAETIGRPILYGTNDKFLEYFGINDINELPTPKDFSVEDIDPEQGRNQHAEKES